ncbi:heme-binding protein [Chelatococcus sp. SYSU_G07232]|uniref:Heme-binding protein n=1 Tax=Chelatococcus albus TaxID=3047466 RepID=A0ABT7AIQ4_9HYPH|nr:heme-binding protein [Chelatococcus sp. SYSU_G07232]MDJ1159261.1 heme-binding protein [Chelatococcus sp. SYSU_G07232]
MPKHLLAAAAAAATLAFVGAPAQAQVLQERNMPLGLAVELAQATVDACAAKNYNVAAAVVDRNGVLRALLRADRAGPHTVDSARRKAFTSASMRAPTGAIAENVEKNPAARQLVAIDGFLVLGGGVPVKIGEETIGAVGAGGAPGGHLDEECAKAGIEKIQTKLK